LLSGVEARRQDCETAHLPDTIAEAFPYYRSLTGRKLSNESHQLIVVPRQAAEKSPLPATINAAIIDPPRYQIAILIVADFLSRLSRYRRMTELRKAVVDNCRIGNRN
jgi:hypothetical protein